MKQRLPLIITLALIMLIGVVWCYVFLISPAQETLDQQVQDVASQLRCPVCQGESVADSPSTLASQMRGVIRQQLQAGKSKQQIIQYFIDRYGDNIAWSPPWQGIFLLAWIVPMILVFGGAIVLFFLLRSWQTVAMRTEDREEAVDEEELARYRAQLEQELAADDPLFSKPGTEVR